jgi:hypothetical protein
VSIPLSWIDLLDDATGFLRLKVFVDLRQNFLRLVLEDGVESAKG